MNGRQNLVDVLRAAGAMLSAKELAARLGKTAASVIQMLHALREDDVVEREKRGREWVWGLTGEPLPERPTRGAEVDRSIYDHRLLAAALEGWRPAA